MSNKIKLLMVPDGLLRGEGSPNAEDRVVTQIGENFRTEEDSPSVSNRLIRGKDGYLKVSNIGDGVIGYDEQGVPFLFHTRVYQNEIRNTVNPNNGNWGTQFTILEKADVISPEGKDNALLLRSDNVTANQQKYARSQVVNSVANGQYWQYSCFLKKYSESSRVFLRVDFTNRDERVVFNFDTEVASLFSTDDTLGARAIKYNDGWYRVIMWGQYTDTDERPFVYVNTTLPADGNNIFYDSPNNLSEGVYFYGPMFITERNGVVPANGELPYIPNNTSSVIAGRNLGYSVSWSNNEIINTLYEGILFIDTACIQNSPSITSSFNESITFFNSSDNSIRISFRFNLASNAVRFYIEGTGTSVVDETITSADISGFEREDRHRYLFIWSATQNSYEIYVDGNSVVAGTFDATNLGTPSSTNLNAYESSIGNSIGTNTFTSPMYGLILSEYDDQLVKDLIALN